MKTEEAVKEAQQNQEVQDQKVPGDTKEQPVSEQKESVEYKVHNNTDLPDAEIGDETKIKVVIITGGKEVDITEGQFLLGALLDNTKDEKGKGTIIGLNLGHFPSPEDLMAVITTTVHSVATVLISEMRLTPNHVTDLMEHCVRDGIMKAAIDHVEVTNPELATIGKKILSGNVGAVDIDSLIHGIINSSSKGSSGLSALLASMGGHDPDCPMGKINDLMNDLQKRRARRNNS